MTFAGNDAMLNVELRDAAVEEVQGLGKYNPRPVFEEEYPESLGFPTDEPPLLEYLGNSKYVLTGEFYTDPGGVGHFQLWLWNSGDGSLVYTDEMVAGDIDEVLSYMPTMIDWIFSHIPEEATAGQSSWLTADTRSPRYDAEHDLFNRWLYVGLRGGGSFRFYTLPASTKDYYFDAPYDFTYEASLQVAFRFLSFMSIQAEAVFTHDRAKLRGPEYYESGGESWHILYTDSYSSTSLLFPVTVKFPLVLDPYIISPFAGVYWTLPLGGMMLDSNIAARKTGEFDYELSGRFGLTVGVDVGVRLGPGILFLDARYGSDFGKTLIHMDDGGIISYKRSMLSISIGYELALLNKKQHAGGN
jgi:hypothetical protein